MSQKNQPESNSDQELNLKHRVTGAAVLLFVGALFIPWLLGPPSQASKKAEAIAGESTDISSPAELESQLLAELDTANSEPEETVYISKITPLDVEQGGGSSDANADADSTVDKSETNPQPLNVASVEQQQANNAEAEKAKREKEAKALAQKKAEQEAEEKTKEKADKLAKEAQETKQREDALQAALAAESESKAESKPATGVDVGWVVQVGLYLEKKGAEAKVKELLTQGFSASSTIVDTNRGPQTGTRVWLGPFAKRAEAEQENTKLVNRTKKEGFIRVYP